MKNKKKTASSEFGNLYMCVNYYKYLRTRVHICIRKPNLNDQTLRRNCLLKYVIQGQVQGRMKGIGRLGGGRQQLLYDFKEIR